LRLLDDWPLWAATRTVETAGPHAGRVLLEAVPNVSLGPQDEALEAVLDALEARASPGWALLDVHTDPDHHRTVLTMAGARAPLLEAHRTLVDALIEHASLAGHVGVHPRLGMLDVAPFVALDAKPQDTLDTARALADRLAAASIPAYGFGGLAQRPERRELATIRRENRTTRPGQRPPAPPDFGPESFHETMGAACVGQRGLLVAYNVLLDTTDLHAGNRIARQIRASNGGLPGVQALAFPLASREDRVQVSTNITDVGERTCADAYEAVTARARELDVPVLGGELVGLAPEAALPEDPQRMGLDERPASLEAVLAEHGFAYP